MVRLPAILAVGLLSCLLLAGCTGDGGGEDDGPSSTTSTWTPPADPCPSVTSSSTVPSWTKHGGQWGLLPTHEGRVDVVCGKATAPLDRLLSDLLGPFDDVELRVSYAMLVGDWGLTEETLDSSDAGAGVVLNYRDAGNYTIVRYSPRENGWHLFTMTSGNRDKVDEASVTPPTTNPEYGEWVALRVVSDGGHVTAFHGETKVIDYQLPATASQSGRVGYFLRDAGMVALFDDFTAVPLA